MEDGHPIAHLARVLPGPRRPRRARWTAVAAVAAILRPAGGGAELLFIRRPVRRRDRWSGDVAFPGGVSRPGEHPVATAVRETREEVAIDLGEPLGRLRAQLTAEPGRLRPMWVIPFVFRVDAGTRPHPEPAEVAEAFWVDLGDLLRRSRARMWKRFGRVALSFPHVDLDGRVLWGLTLRMVDDLARSLR